LVELFSTDRGLFLIPHTVALCLLARQIYGVGNIRTRAEALRPVVWTGGAL
jgi:hypothetical protein